jgi:hypothetical protein
VWLSAVIVAEVAAIGLFGTDYLRSTMEDTAGVAEGRRLARHDGIEIGFLGAAGAADRDDVPEGRGEQEAVEGAAGKEEADPDERAREEDRALLAAGSGRGEQETGERRPSRSRAEAELSRPTETNVDGLTGASKTWVPSEVSAARGSASATVSRAAPDELDDLVGSALDGPRAEEVARPEKRTNTLAELVTGELPATPSRAQVKRSMEAVSSAIKACGDGSGGRIKLELGVVGATGRVVSARPTRDSGFAGTPVGICAARKARLAKLPPFKQGRLTIKYPFDL